MKWIRWVLLKIQSGQTDKVKLSPVCWPNSGSWNSLISIKDKDLHILDSQSNVYWWLGEAKNQGISIRDIDQLAWNIPLPPQGRLTHKHLETHGCMINTVANDGLVLKHQAHMIRSADLVFIVLPNILTKSITFAANNKRNQIIFEKKIYPVVWGLRYFPCHVICT